MGSSSSDPRYVDVTYIGKGRGDGWGIRYSIMDLSATKLGLSLLDLQMDHQKERGENLR